MFRPMILAACLAVAPLIATAQEMAPPPAGTYHLDPAHARLLFQVSHIGLSNYTALFTGFEATLTFDPRQSRPHDADGDGRCGLG